MDVIINEVSSTVHLNDADTLMDAERFQQLVRAVVDAIDARNEHESRLASQRQITAGSTDWLRGS